eukprot:6213321-Pleurochrysis_carterae.AAC.5
MRPRVRGRVCSRVRAGVCVRLCERERARAPRASRSDTAAARRSQVAMSNITVTVKWGKQKLEAVPLQLDAPVIEFKAVLQSLTGVPAERQKIMGVKGGLPKARARAARASSLPQTDAAHASSFCAFFLDDEIPTIPVKSDAQVRCGSQDDATWEGLGVKQAAAHALMT